MAGAFLPEVHRVGEGLLPRSHILGRYFCMIASARCAIFRRRSVSAVVTHPAPCRLRIGLHGGSSRKPRIEHESRKAVVDTEGIYRFQSFLGIKRLHRTRRVFWRHKRERTAAKWAQQAWDPHLGKRRRTRRTRGASEAHDQESNRNKPEAPHSRFPSMRLETPHLTSLISISETTKGPICPVAVKKENLVPTGRARSFQGRRPPTHHGFLLFGICWRIGSRIFGCRLLVNLLRGF